jgi:ribosome-associated translation inhibitor RaiA
MDTTVKRVPVDVTLRGNVGEFAGEYARSKVSDALQVASKPVLRAHVVLDWRHDPAVERHAVAEATAEVDGFLVRAKTAAPTMNEAVDDLEYRLRRRLVQLQERERERHRWTGVSAEHEWRHGDLPRRPLAYFPRSEQTRALVRHKSFASTPMTVDEAVYEMELLDHDFFLYRDVASGSAALVHRLADGGYGVQGVERGETVGTVRYEPPPPALTYPEARARLEAGHEPFVFFLDSTSRRGRVLYHRYDGHYGLIDLSG